MALNRLLQLGIVSTITFGVLVSGNAVLANSAAQTSIFDHRMADSLQQVAQNLSVLAAGNFMAAEAPTTGTARIVTEGGHRYLELDTAFSTTDQAPDLHVLLDTTATPPGNYSSFGSYVNLGSLQNFTGAQRYPIPDAIDLDDYQSVVIWCRMVNATIGYATLNQ